MKRMSFAPKGEASARTMTAYDYDRGVYLTFEAKATCGVSGCRSADAFHRSVSVNEPPPTLEGFLKKFGYRIIRNPDGRGVICKDCYQKGYTPSA